MARLPITCNAICPGFVRTPLAEAQIAPLAKAHNVSEEVALEDLLLVHQPSKRWVEVEEIARMALYLVGPGSDGLNGAACPSMAGGWRPDGRDVAGGAPPRDAGRGADRRPARRRAAA